MEKEPEERLFTVGRAELFLPRGYTRHDDKKKQFLDLCYITYKPP